MSKQSERLEEERRTQIGLIQSAYEKYKESEPGAERKIAVENMLTKLALYDAIFPDRVLVINGRNYTAKQLISFFAKLFICIIKNEGKK